MIVIIALPLLDHSSPHSSTPTRFAQTLQHTTHCTYRHAARRLCWHALTPALLHITSAHNTHKRSSPRSHFLTANFSYNFSSRLSTPHHCVFRSRNQPNKLINIELCSSAAPTPLVPCHTHPLVSLPALPHAHTDRTKLSHTLITRVNPQHTYYSATRLPQTLRSIFIPPRHSTAALAHPLFHAVFRTLFF